MSDRDDREGVLSGFAERILLALRDVQPEKARALREEFWAIYGPVESAPAHTEHIRVGTAEAGDVKEGEG